MIELRSATKLYIAALIAAVAGMGVPLLQRTGGMSGREAGLALVLAALMVLTHLFPLHFTHQTKLTLDTAVIFASVLVFEPGLAMLLVGGGSLLAFRVRRASWVETAFNTAQAMLQAGTAGLLLAASGWDF